MSGASVHLGTGTSITVEPAPASGHGIPPRVLLTIERTAGDVLNCALIPVHRIPAIVAALQLAGELVTGPAA